MTCDDASRVKFYADLGCVLSEVPKADKLVVFGDFNAHVGNNCPGWSCLMGTQVRGRFNSNSSLNFAQKWTLRSLTPFLPYLTNGTILGCTHAHTRSDTKYLIAGQNSEGKSTSSSS